LRRNPYRRKKRQKKSIFIYGTTFKKNESGRDFQRGQIWNDRSQKPKKNYGSHPMCVCMHNTFSWVNLVPLFSEGFSSLKALENDVGLSWYRSN
jgi:hypothetical protein